MKTNKFKDEIMLMDATYLEGSPNREITLFKVNYWAKNKGVNVLLISSRIGIEFYKKELDNASMENVGFIEIPFSSNPKNIYLLLIPFEYLKRIIGIFFLKLNTDNVSLVSTVTPIIVDVISALIIKLLNKNIKAVINYDNFVPRPSERPGAYSYNLIPYAAYKITLFFLAYADGIISCMDPIAIKRLSRKVGSHVKILKLNNGVNYEKINAVEDSEDKKYDVVYLGRIHKAKGILDFLYVVKELKKSNNNIRACVIGSTEDKQIMGDINLYINNNSLKDSIDFVGYVSNSNKKYKLLKRSKLLLFLSYDDSGPISVLESIACKLPIVVYDLDPFKLKPFSDAYINTFSIGDRTSVMLHVKDFLENYNSFYKVVCRYYDNKKIVISQLDSAKSEYLFLTKFFKKVA